MSEGFDLFLSLVVIDDVAVAVAVAVQARWTNRHKRHMPCLGGIQPISALESDNQTLFPFWNGT